MDETRSVSQKRAVVNERVGEGQVMAMLRIALVGCGRIMPAHLHAYKALWDLGVQNFRIVALVARKEEDALRFRKRGEGPPPRPPVTTNPADPLGKPHLYVSDIHDDVLPEIFTDWREMLERAEVDLVDIYTTVHTHHEIAVAALQAGKHVQVEKPMAVSVRAGRLMVDAAKRNGRVLMVAESVRYNPLHRMVRWVLERGVIGDIQAFHAFSFGSDWSPDKVVAQTPWRHQKLLAGGGATIDIGVHLWHLARYWCGEVAEIFAYTPILEPVRFLRDEHGNIVQQVHPDADDTFLALCRFEQGAYGLASFSWGGHAGRIGAPTSVFGTKGCIIGDRLKLDDGTDVTVREFFDAHASDADKERLFPMGIQDAFTLEKWDWFRAIEQATEAEASGEEGLRDLATAFAMCESFVARRPVQIAEVLSGQVDAYQRPIDEHYGLV
jgi:predicted dehydrogenase